MKSNLTIKAILLACLLFQAGAILAQTSDELLVRAKESIQKGDFDAAILDASAVIKSKPKNGDAYTQRARAYVLLKNYDLALADAEKALAIDSKNTDALNVRGLVRVSRKELDAAITDFTSAINLKPDSIKAYNNRASVWVDKKEFEKAVADYSKLVSLDPQNSNPYYLRGIIYADSLKNSDLAIKDFSETIKLLPSSYAAYYRRGMVYASVRDYDKAIFDFSKAIELEPSNAFNYYFRGLAFSRLNKIPEATADYRKAIELDPKYQEFADALAEITKKTADDGRITISGETDAEKAKRLEETLPIAAGKRINAILFMPDGKSIVAMDEVDKPYAWSLPDFQSIAPPAWVRNSASDKPFVEAPPIVVEPMYKALFQVSPPNENAWEWKYSSKVATRQIGYETHLKRLYFYELINNSQNSSDGFSVKIFSVARGEKKPKLEGQTTLDKNSALFVSAEGKIVKFTSDSQYLLQDMNGNVLFKGERLVKTYTSVTRNLEKPKAFVSTDGTRFVIDNFAEKVVIRLSDGVKLLQINEDKYYQEAMDRNGQFAAFSYTGTKPDTLYGLTLTAYRTKVYVISETPGNSPEIVYLSTPGARESALADIKAHDQKEKVYLAREAVRQEEQRRAAAEQAARQSGQNASTQLDQMMQLYNTSAVRFIELGLQIYVDEVKKPNSTSASRCEALAKLNTALKQTQSTYDRVLEAKRIAAPDVGDGRLLILDLWQELRVNYTSLVKENGATDGCKLDRVESRAVN